MTAPTTDRSLSERELSVIVPTLNEAALIADFLVHLRATVPGAEIIVVDGGSHDGTAALVGQHAVRVLRSPPGRARQMNAGAAVAGGQVLWFVHADSRVPADPFGGMARALADPRMAGGCFRLRLPRRQWVYRISDRLGNLAVDLFQIALGDHGIFCRRVDFERAGGYPNVPLMEDAELYRRLRRGGRRMRQLSDHIVSSPRRYEQLGPLRTTVCYLVILCLYLVKVPPDKLQKIYRKLIGRRQRAPARAPQVFRAS